MKDSKKKKDVFSAALECVSRASLSEFELASRLERKLYSNEEVREAVKKMVDYGYVDNAKVADALVRKAQRDCRGPRWLQSYLIKKRIPREISKDALNTLSAISAELASQILFARVAKLRASEDFNKAKLYRFLAGRGFYPEAIHKAFNALENHQS